MSTSMSWEDLEIASLSSKMETMAFEFADMLKEEWRLNVGGDVVNIGRASMLKMKDFKRLPFWLSFGAAIIPYC